MEYKVKQNYLYSISWCNASLTMMIYNNLCQQAFIIIIIIRCKYIINYQQNKIIQSREHRFIFTQVDSGSRVLALVPAVCLVWRWNWWKLMRPRWRGDWGEVLLLSPRNVSSLHTNTPYGRTSRLSQKWTEYFLQTRPVSSVQLWTV